MLDPRGAGGKAEDIAQKTPFGPGPADKAAFGLDHEHQVRRIGQVALAPDLALQVLGQTHLGHARKVAEADLGHGVSSCTDRVAWGR